MKILLAKNNYINIKRCLSEGAAAPSNRIEVSTNQEVDSLDNPSNSNNINERIEHITVDEESSDYDELFVVDSVNELKEFMNKTRWNEYRVVDSSRYDGKYYVGYSMNHIHSQILRVAANNGWFPNENGSTIQMKFSDTDLVIIIPGEDNDNGVFGTDAYCVKYIFNDYTILARDYIDNTELIKKFGKLIDVVDIDDVELDEKIKRYYSSGTLYESTSATLLYRGVGYNNKPSQDIDNHGGKFFADNVMDASNFGDKIEVYELSSKAKLFRYRSSYDYVQENNLMDIENDVLYQLSGYHTLSEAEETLLMCGENPNLYYAMMQYIVRLDLEPQGYDGVEWEYEDDLISHQYQIWNDKVITHIKDVNENGNELKENMKETFTTNDDGIVTQSKEDRFTVTTWEGNKTLYSGNSFEDAKATYHKANADGNYCSFNDKTGRYQQNNLNEDNELEDRAKKHKKKSKGMGWHMAMNAGDVEKGMEVFNNSTSANCVTGDCGVGMGESLSEGATTGTYCYDGPIYYRGYKISEKSNHCTTAPSMSVAARNIWYQVSKNEPDPYNYEIVDRLIRFVPDSRGSYNLSPNRAKCHRCGYDINDNGDCPVCDYGEIDLLESLSDLEAMWKLSSMNLD